jgi:uncharacterized membrane protein
LVFIVLLLKPFPLSLFTAPILLLGSNGVTHRPPIWFALISIFVTCLLVRVGAWAVAFMFILTLIRSICDQLLHRELAKLASYRHQSRTLRPDG